MKKIIIIGYVDRNNLSGPSVVVESLIKGLNCLNVDYEFINAYSTGIVKKLLYFVNVFKLIFSKNISVNVHTFGYKNPLLVRFLCDFNKSCSFHLTAHGILSFENELNGIDTNKKYIKLEKKLYSKTKNIICVSDYFRTIFRERFGNNNNVYVVPNGLVSYKNEFTLKTDISFAYAGGFSALKNPLECVDIFRNSLELFPEARLYMCGPTVDSDLKEKTSLYIKENKLEDRITVLGKVSQDELNRIFEKSMFIIAPSKFDTFNMVVLEAMNRGCIPIISNHCGIKEVLEGRCGIVYQSIEDIVERLKTMDVYQESKDSFMLSLEHTYIDMTKAYMEVMGMRNE